MAIIGTAVGEASTTYNMLLAARIVQGFCISAFESLLVASVGYAPSVAVLMTGIFFMSTNAVLEYRSSTL
jgi:predicted MFS family arabinose efflux permease